MKEIWADNVGKELTSKKSKLVEILENQPPFMYWWFAFTSISLCSVYVILLTKL